jgi:hypothetical protein
VHDRDFLQLRIQYPKDATSTTPTILRLSHRFSPAPAAPSTAIVIDLWKPLPKIVSEEIGDAAEEAGKEAEDAGKDVEETGEEVEDAGKEAEEAGEEAGKVGKEAEEVGKEVEEAEKEAEEEEEIWEEALDTTYPTILHDITASLLTIRSLFPESKTGILAAGYPAAWALSTALTQGREKVAAVAVDSPIVDLFAEGAVAWDRFNRAWVYRKTGPDGAPIWQSPDNEDSTPDPRRQIYGEDPALYWEDSFASPLFFFVTPGVKFPKIYGRDDYASSDLEEIRHLEIEPEARRDLNWPPMGFTPGYGWGLHLKDKGMAPRMLLNFGTGEQARAQGLFVSKARRPYKGLQKQVEVGILRQGLSSDVLGKWLERTLLGADVGAIKDPDAEHEVPILELGTAAEVLLARGLQPLEHDTRPLDTLEEAPIEVGAGRKNMNELPSVEELLERERLKDIASLKKVHQNSHSRFSETTPTAKKIPTWEKPVAKMKAAPSTPIGETKTSLPATAKQAMFRLSGNPTGKK